MKQKDGARGTYSGAPRETRNEACRRNLRSVSYESWKAVRRENQTCRRTIQDRPRGHRSSEITAQVTGQRTCLTKVFASPIAKNCFSEQRRVVSTSYTTRQYSHCTG